MIGMIAGITITSQLLKCQSRSKSQSQSRSRSCDSQSLRHNHGHYIHHDDALGMKQSCSYVVLCCPKLECKSPSVLHQPRPVELTTMALVHWNDEQPPPTPDAYLGEVLDASNGIDSEDHQPPPSNSDEDSYSSYCPKNKKYSCKRPPTIQSERNFLQRFETDSRHMPYWVMLEIQVDLQKEYYIPFCASSAAELRRKLMLDLSWSQKTVCSGELARTEEVQQGQQRYCKQRNHHVDSQPLPILHCSVQLRQQTLGHCVAP